MELDKTQNDIVYSNKNKIIVNAGAGSGKTRVLIERIKRLINDGVEPSSIVAITFTNTAADEMKQRISEVGNTNGMFVGTIHSFANMILEQSDEEYCLYTDDLENYYINCLIKKYAKYLDYKKYLKFKQIKERERLGLRVKQRSVDVLNCNEYMEYECFFKSKAREDYPETVYDLARRDNAITFDELIERATDYFESTNSKIEYLFVDEFQDVGSLEYGFLEALNANNYFLVGDDYQAIFGFKGGCVEIFLSLCNNPQWTYYVMGNNYRCSQSVINAANVVIQQADDIIDKPTNCLSGVEGDVVFGEKRLLVEYVSMISDAEECYGNLAILVRTNKDLEKVQAILKANEIPCTSFKKSDLTLEEIKKQMTCNKVKVLTVHASKGLEFENVILYGNFPYHEPRWNHNSDERKVMYVGMTRAINRLYIL
nr:MAG TPA: REP HELICASE [Bacteriophage sp.]